MALSDDDIEYFLMSSKYFITDFILLGEKFFSEKIGALRGGRLLPFKQYCTQSLINGSILVNLRAGELKIDATSSGSGFLFFKAARV